MPLEEESSDEISEMLRRFYEPTPLNLDVSVLRFTNDRQRTVAEAIKTATELARLKLRSKGDWAVHVPYPPRGFAPGRGKSASGVPLADLLPWTSILTIGSCLHDAARIAKCTHEEVLSQALRSCSVDQLVPLLNFVGMNDGLQATAKALAMAIKPMREKQDQLKRSASVGGKKSAVTRRARAKTPPPEKLREVRDRLIAQGKSERSVTSILAARYGVHPTTIRRNLANPS